MSGLLLLGPCPTCGKAFESRDRKAFCSMICYHRSDRFKEIIKQRAASQTIAETRSCVCCGAEFVTKPSARKQTCSKICQRRWFSERHDRWVANPQKIALPQAYDEFLTQDELRCIVEGCEWTGRNLSMHVNYEHGIPADEFKALAGFNRKTGLVSADLSKALSDRSYSHLRDNPEATAEHLAKMRAAKEEKGGGQRAKARLEGREHARKNFAEIRADASATENTYACGRCGALFARAGMKRNAKYCDPCRPLRSAERHAERNAPLTCARCAGEFLGNAGHRLRAKKGRAVFCPPCLVIERVAKLARGRQNMKPKQRNIPERGPCPTCEKMFRHYAPLKYCGRVCQQAAPDFKQKMLKNLAPKVA